MPCHQVGQRPHRLAAAIQVRGAIMKVGPRRDAVIAGLEKTPA